MSLHGPVATVARSATTASLSPWRRSSRGDTIDDSKSSDPKTPKPLQFLLKRLPYRRVLADRVRCGAHLTLQLRMQAGNDIRQGRGDAKAERLGHCASAKVSAFAKQLVDR